MTLTLFDSSAARTLSAVGWVAALSVALLAKDAQAQSSIALANPGGEAYVGLPPGPTSPNVEINPGGVDPLALTGWNSTQSYNALSAIEAIANSANSGAVRLAFGAVTDGTGSSISAPEDVVIFQETSHVVASGEEFILNFFGRGFFRYNNGVDAQTSLFGYLDGGGNLVQIDSKPHPEVVAGAWTSVSHSFIVPAGSPLIGQKLVVGFFTASGDFAAGTPNTGAFSSIDDVSLTLGVGGRPGDADGDGDVDFDDVQLIANNFLETVPVSTFGDVSNDGVVDFADFRIWKQDSGFAGSLEQALAGVPEPSALLLACVAFTAAARGAVRRKHR